VIFLNHARDEPEQNKNQKPERTTKMYTVIVEETPGSHNVHTVGNVETLKEAREIADRMMRQAFASGGFARILDEETMHEVDFFSRANPEL
jgi:hypothetical protein